VQIVMPQMVCPASTIQMVAAACSTGVSSSATCLSALQQLYAQNGACASCLSNFTFDFVNLDGVYACALPYVSAMCGQQAQCYLDCLNTVCQGCGGATLPACLTQSGPGVCSAYGQGNTCVDAALMGPAALCDPAKYSNLGAWLAAVATAYCAM
jgi:hypothetical protein